MGFATSEDPKEISRGGQLVHQLSLWIPLESGANDGIRTRDLLITNQLLYQLSYIGVANNPFCTESFAGQADSLQYWHKITGTPGSLSLLESGVGVRFVYHYASR